MNDDDELYLDALFSRDRRGGPPRDRGGLARSGAPGYGSRAQDGSRGASSSSSDWLSVGRADDLLRERGPRVIQETPEPGGDRGADVRPSVLDRIGLRRDGRGGRSVSAGGYGGGQYALGGTQEVSPPRKTSESTTTRRRLGEPSPNTAAGRGRQRLKHAFLYESDLDDEDFESEEDSEAEVCGKCGEFPRANGWCACLLPFWEHKEWSAMSVFEKDRAWEKIHELQRQEKRGPIDLSQDEEAEEESTQSTQSTQSARGGLAQTWDNGVTRYDRNPTRAVFMTWDEATHEGLEEHIERVIGAGDGFTGALSREKYKRDGRFHFHALFAFGAGRTVRPTGFLKLLIERGVPEQMLSGVNLRRAREGEDNVAKLYAYVMKGLDRGEMTVVCDTHGKAKDGRAAEAELRKEANQILVRTGNLAAAASYLASSSSNAFVSHAPRLAKAVPYLPVTAYDSPAALVLLMGEPGAGKTTLAYEMADQYAGEEHQVTLIASEQFYDPYMMQSCVIVDDARPPETKLTKLLSLTNPRGNFNVKNGRVPNRIRVAFITLPDLHAAYGGDREWPNLFQLIRRCALVLTVHGVEFGGKRPSSGGVVVGGSYTAPSATQIDALLASWPGCGLTSGSQLRTPSIDSSVVARLGPATSPAAKILDFPNRDKSVPHKWRNFYKVSVWSDNRGRADLASACRGLLLPGEV